jgi:hypothetical protein
MLTCQVLKAITIMSYVQDNMLKSKQAVFGMELIVPPYNTHPACRQFFIRLKPIAKTVCLLYMQTP